MNEQQTMLAMPKDEFCRMLEDLLRRLPPASANSAVANASHDEEATAELLNNVPQRVLDDFAADVAAPVQVVHSDRYRAVVVLRIFAVVFEKGTGLARAALLRDGGAHQAALENPEPSVRLLHSPQGSHWIGYWVRNWYRRHGYACDADWVARFVDIAAHEGWRFARRHLDLPAMRRSIAAAMDYEPTHWRRAVRLAASSRRDLDPNQSDYNHTIEFAPWLDTLEWEAPNLMAPWFALAREGELDSTLEPQAALKKWVCKATGSERTWRSLAASSPRVWMAWGCRANAGAAIHLRDTAMLVKQFATAAPIPAPLMRALTARLDPLVPLEKRIHAGRCRHYPFALRAANEAADTDAWPRFLEELDDVDTWFDLEAPAPDKLQRRRGWPWLVRKARAWAEMQRRRQLARDPLIPALAALEFDGYVFGAARTPFDLWQAGRELRNCLGSPTYSRLVAGGESLVVLARRQRNGRMVAAIDLRADAGNETLNLARAQGFANAPAPREVGALLPRVAAHFDEQLRARLLPWRIGRPDALAIPLAACPLPQPYDRDTSDLQLTSDGCARLGHWQRNFSAHPTIERFVTTRIIRGGHAQRLAEHAIALAGASVETLDALAAAIATALASQAGYDHWFTVFGATAPLPESAQHEDPAHKLIDLASTMPASSVASAEIGTYAAHGIDLDFRPRSYHRASSPGEEVLLRISGTHRRRLAQRMIDAGADPREIEGLADEAQPPGMREVMMSIHPALSGGEYLPGRGNHDEVEIARMELVGSVLGDVTSVRASPNGCGYDYSIVDEHGTDIRPGIGSAIELLTMRELIDLMERADPPLGIAFLRGSLGQGTDRDDLRTFLRMQSFVYPQLRAWYEREIDAFLRIEPANESAQGEGDE